MNRLSKNSFLILLLLFLLVNELKGQEKKKKANVKKREESPHQREKRKMRETKYWEDYFKKVDNMVDNFNLNSDQDELIEHLGSPGTEMDKSYPFYFYQKRLKRNQRFKMRDKKRNIRFARRKIGETPLPTREECQQFYHDFKEHCRIYRDLRQVDLDNNFIKDIQNRLKEKEPKNNFDKIDREIADEVVSDLTIKNKDGVKKIEKLASKKKKISDVKKKALKKKSRKLQAPKKRKLIKKHKKRSQKKLKKQNKLKKLKKRKMQKKQHKKKKSHRKHSRRHLMIKKRKVKKAHYKKKRNLMIPGMPGGGGGQAQSAPQIDDSRIIVHSFAAPPAPQPNLIRSYDGNGQDQLIQARIQVPPRYLKLNKNII
jgi:hypothetical protein